MDLSNILESNKLQFTSIKQKIGLLKTFELNDNIQVEDESIVIVSNQSNYEINDPFTKMQVWSVLGETKETVKLRDCTYIIIKISNPKITRTKTTTKSDRDVLLDTLWRQAMTLYRCCEKNSMVIR